MLFKLFRKITTKKRSVRNYKSGAWFQCKVFINIMIYDSTAVFCNFQIAFCSITCFLYCRNLYIVCYKIIGNSCCGVKQVNIVGNKLVFYIWVVSKKTTIYLCLFGKVNVLCAIFNQLYTSCSFPMCVTCHQL